MRRSVLLGIGLALAVLAGLWTLVLREEPQHAAVTAAVGAAEPAVDETARVAPGTAPEGKRPAVGAARRTTSQGAASLPPRDTPIAAAYDELVARARAGDARAACRLAQGLERCGTVPYWRQQVAFDETRVIDSEEKRGAPKEQIDQMIDFGAEKRLRLERLEAYCAGLPPEHPEETYDWMLRAADLGSIPAATRFATRPPISVGDLLDHLDRLETFRLRAPDLAQRALAAGDPNIVVPLSRAYLATPEDQIRSFLGQAVKHDVVQGYALLRLSTLIAGAEREYETKSLEGLRLKMSAAQVDQAEAIATELRRAQFAHAPKPKPRSEHIVRDGATEEYCD